MEQTSIKMNNTSEELLKKVMVNEDDDYIVVNANDATLVERYAELIQWLENQQTEMETKANELEEKYKGQSAVTKDEDGTVNVNTEMILELTRVKSDLYKEVCTRIDNLFGQEVVNKYFKSCYELNSDFVPDEECIIDMVNSLSEVIEKIYKARLERIRKKYSTNRQGRRARRNK